MTRSFSMFVWFGLIIGASLALYHTSDRVHELNTQLNDINAAIDAERQSIHVLKADWVYLSNPDRVSKIAKRHLDVRPSNPRQIAALSEVTQILPTRNEAMTHVAVSSTPIANVRSTLAAMASHPSAVVKAKHVTQVASAADAPRQNDHMIMQRAPMQVTASAAPVGDSIGAYINGLDQAQ